MGDDRTPVLVVDDSPDFLRVVRAVLEELDPPFAVYTVRTGGEAFAFIDRRPPFADAPRPAFILLDFRLPDMTAPAVLVGFGTRGLLGGTPVLVLSQAGWAEDEAAATAAGAHAYRVKPSRIEGLREVLTTFWMDHCHGATHPRH